MKLHIHAGGTTRTLCDQPLVLGTNVSWEQATDATCVPCAAHFGRRVPQFGPEWVAHATSGGRILDGNLLVGVTA
jgi:hypothetical protein